ncbi:hypothetical protein FXW78_08840 [Rhodococcus opacus]|nr:hypothetical protein [Rhodococcus opacus]RZL77265.1 MAG: hypothetical protein EOP32_25570 [Rhodococcus sp. (in: high G+C Gram-positive bacteria)]
MSGVRATTPAKKARSSSRPRQMPRPPSRWATTGLSNVASGEHLTRLVDAHLLTVERSGRARGRSWLTAFGLDLPAPRREPQAIRYCVD